MTPARIPVIIDTDPGVDDAVALMLTAASPELRLLAITTVFGNVALDITTDNALRLRALADMGHVPVARGAARPLVYRQRERADSFHAADGLGGQAATLPQPSDPVNARGAITLMSDLISAMPDRVTLVAIGPLTNIALLLAAHPEVKSGIARIVVMGGSLTSGNTAGPGIGAEFNLHCDPEAARRVLVEEDVPVTLVPLDLTLRAGVDGAWLDELARAGPRCATLASMVRHYRQRFGEHARSRSTAPAPRSAPVPVPAARPAGPHDDVVNVAEPTPTAPAAGDTVPLHDSLAVLEAAVPGTLHTTPMRLEVICDHGPARGALVPVDTGAREVDVAFDADLPALSATILARLRSLR